MLYISIHTHLDCLFLHRELFRLATKSVIISFRYLSTALLLSGTMADQMLLMASWIPGLGSYL